MSLSGKQRRHLRALGHHLDPVVLLGRQGLTAGVLQALDAALLTHELVKVKLGPECPEGRDEVASQLAATLHVEVAQVLGHTVLVYRRHPEKPVIVLPA
jgi:RNA-binding protein